MAKSMLHGTGVEIDSLWAEAVNTAFLTDRLVSKSRQDNITHFEVIRGKPPNIRHLKRFSVKAFLFNPKDKIKDKFDAKCKFGTFVGYSHGDAYGILFQYSSIVVPKDVTFHESFSGAFELNANENLNAFDFENNDVILNDLKDVSKGINTTKTASVELITGPINRMNSIEDTRH